MPYTATNWVEGVTTLGPTNMNKIENELVYLDARIPAAAVNYGTTLPASPVDGQQAILVDSLSAPTYQWAFRWNAGSTWPDKWEYIGGSDWTGWDPNAVSSSSASFVSLGTMPPFTLPRAGVYKFSWGGQGYTATAGAGVYAYITIFVGGTGFATLYLASPANGTYSSAGGAGPIESPRQTAGGVVVDMRHAIQGGGTGNWLARWMAIRPVRVS